MLPLKPRVAEGRKSQARWRALALADIRACLTSTPCTPSSRLLIVAPDGLRYSDSHLQSTESRARNYYDPRNWRSYKLLK